MNLTIMRYRDIVNRGGEFVFRKVERGSVTVEATISLTAFLFFFLMIYCMIDVCIMQAKISCALNNSAKEISQYSYLYGVTGLNEGFTALRNSGQDARNMTNDVVKSIGETYENIQSLSGKIQGASNLNWSNMDDVQASWDDIASQAKTTQDSFNDTTSVLSENIEKLCDEPKDVMLGFARVFAFEGLDYGVNNVIIPEVTRALMMKHLKRSDNDDPARFLHDYRVIKGTYSSYKRALVFKHSKVDYTYDDSQALKRELRLVCSYQVSPIRYLPLDLKYTITVSARTKPWLNGDGAQISIKE